MSLQDPDDREEIRAAFQAINASQPVDGAVTLLNAAEEMREIKRLLRLILRILVRGHI